MKINYIISNVLDKLGTIFSYIFLVLCFIGMIIGAIGYFTKTEKTSTPVEECKINSAIKENNKLIIEINNLDSIKDAKIIEVKSLDNDSTLKLFYQLIGK